MGELSQLPNIGKELERQLCKVRIETVTELREIGSEQAWLRILALDPSACLHRLRALEGAIRGIPKTALPEEEKERLKKFFTAVKKGKSD